MSARLCRDPELWRIVVGSLGRRDVRWWVFQSFGDREARGLCTLRASRMLFGDAVWRDGIPYG